MLLQGIQDSIQHATVTDVLIDTIIFFWNGAQSFLVVCSRMRGNHNNNYQHGTACKGACSYPTSTQRYNIYAIAGTTGHPKTAMARSASVVIDKSDHVENQLNKQDSGSSSDTACLEVHEKKNKMLLQPLSLVSTIRSWKKFVLKPV